MITGLHCHRFMDQIMTTHNFYTNLVEKLDYIGIDLFMIYVDLNLVLNPELDYQNYKHINDKTLEIIQGKLLKIGS